jgi:hypothetical protein
MNSNLERFSALVIAVYAWTISLFLGAVLLDITYANLLADTLGSDMVGEVLSEVADFLLCLGSAVIVSAIAAILFSWKSRTARYLIIGSLLVLLLEFIGPLFFQLIPGIVTLIPGPWLRIIPTGLASWLAFAGLLAYFRPGQGRQ